MLQRGRKTVDQLAALALNGDPPRLKPPPYLNDRERRLFIELVEACSPRHFARSDEPLLIAYVQSILLSQFAVKKAAKDPAMLALWEKSTRMVGMLSTRLRLSVQSRADPKTVARHQPYVGRNPWDDEK